MGTLRPGGENDSLGNIVRNHRSLVVCVDQGNLSEYGGSSMTVSELLNATGNDPELNEN